MMKKAFDDKRSFDELQALDASSTFFIFHLHNMKEIQLHEDDKFHSDNLSHIQH